MLDRLKTFLGELSGRDSEDRFGPADERLAAAALMVHVLAIDGETSTAERTKLHDVLKREYDLSDAETAELMAAARQRDLEAVDLYGFTSILKRSLDDAGRHRLIALLWEMVYADGSAHEFEENIIWRVAELIGISSRDRITLRQQVAGQPARS